MPYDAIDNITSMRKRDLVLEKKKKKIVFSRQGEGNTWRESRERSAARLNNSNYRV